MLRPDAGQRRKDYKKGVDADEARRKREDNIIALRQNKRDENLQKKRSTFTPALPFGGMEDSTKGAAAGRVRRAWRSAQGRRRRCARAVRALLSALLSGGGEISK